MEGHTTNHLHIKMPQAERTPTDFSADRKGIWKDLVQRLASIDPFTKFLALRRKFFVA